MYYPAENDFAYPCIVSTAFNPIFLDLQTQFLMLQSFHVYFMVQSSFLFVRIQFWHLNPNFWNWCATLCNIALGFLVISRCTHFCWFTWFTFFFFVQKKTHRKMVVESPLFLVKSPFFYSFPMVSYDFPWFWCFELFIWWILQASSGARAWTSLVPDGERLSLDLARDGCPSVLLM